MFQLNNSPKRVLFVVLIWACFVAITNCVIVAAEPQPSPSPTPDPTVIAVIDSLVVNGLKSDTASSSDIELLRAGASAPEATVSVGNELRAGDKIHTRDDDQLVLRVPNPETGSDDLVFLDPNSEIGIGSVCALLGRVLSWAGSRFRLCTSWGTLGVEGTEFEVNITTTGELTVLVYEGKVKLDPDDKSELEKTITTETKKPEATAEAVPKPAVQVEKSDILPAAALKLKPDGTAERVEVAPAAKLDYVNYWSEQIIKTSKPVAGVAKGFVNYQGDTQAEEFKKARREALVDNVSTAYLTLGKVLNDWNDGAAAQKSLAKVKDENVRKTPEYMVNVAEADRLQGRLEAADSQLERAKLEHPDYAPVYYLKAKVTEQIVARDPVGKAGDAPQIRKNLTKALSLQSGESHIKQSVVEGDLDRTIQTIGNSSRSKYSWLSQSYTWFHPSSETNSSTARGTATINVGGRRATGRAVLSISGDQFKLKVADEIFTGRIVGNQNSAGISFAMQFDDVGRVDKTKGDAVLSVTGNRLAKGFTLTAARQPAGSFTFTAQRVAPR